MIQIVGSYTYEPLNYACLGFLWKSSSGIGLATVVSIRKSHATTRCSKVHKRLLLGVLHYTVIEPLS